MRYITYALAACIALSAVPAFAGSKEDDKRFQRGYDKDYEDMDTDYDKRVGRKEYDTYMSQGFAHMDTNRDGRIDRDEYDAYVDRDFKNMDMDRDEYLTLDERTAWHKEYREYKKRLDKKYGE